MSNRQPDRSADILLIEDSDGDARLTREALAATGGASNLHVARDGIEALRFLRREGGFEDAPRPDIILLDLNMPRMDGREFLATTKADPVLRPIPMIVLTTSASPQDVAEAYGHGANCYLVKPLDLRVFFGLIAVVEELWLRRALLPTHVPASRE